MIREILAFITEADDLSGEDMKMLSAQPEDKIYTLDEIKAAQPLFFNRRAMRIHGTKKIYKYGNFLVLKNISKLHGGNGNIFHKENFPIYQFVHSDDRPEGYLRKVGNGIHLDDAKEMVKKKDFRDFAVRAGYQPESVSQVAVKTLTANEVHEAGYSTGEIEEFPIRRASIPGAYVDYEEGDHGIWIMFVHTDPSMRNQGLAKKLLHYVHSYALVNNKKVMPGAYTEDGEKYLKRTVQKLWPDAE